MVWSDQWDKHNTCATLDLHMTMEEKISVHLYFIYILDSWLKWQVSAWILDCFISILETLLLVKYYFVVYSESKYILYIYGPQSIPNQNMWYRHKCMCIPDLVHELFSGGVMLSKGNSSPQPLVQSKMDCRFCATEVSNSHWTIIIIFKK